MDHPTNYNTYLRIALAQHENSEELERQKRIRLSRDLYEGTLPDKLTTELENVLLAQSAEFPNLINLTAPVLEEVTNRLVVTGLYDAPQIEGELPAGNIVQWAADWWQAAGLDALQFDIYENAAIDGSTFLLLEPMETPAGVSIVPRVQLEYVSEQLDGSGEGCRAHYENDELTMVSKKWGEWYEAPAGIFGRNARRQKRQRVNLYIAERNERVDGVWSRTPARIEKFVLERGQWQPFADEEGGAWPIWWTEDGTQNGASLPLPVVHFRNRRDRQEPMKTAGSQALLDDALVSLATASGMQGAPMLKAIGGYPTNDGKPIAADGSNLWKIGPKRVVGHPTKSPRDFDVSRIEAGDLSQIMATIDKIVLLTAVTSGTPSLLIDLLGGGQVAAETLKQVDIRPIASTVRLQITHGNAWSQVFEIAAALMRRWVSAENVTTPVHVRWRPADVRGSDVSENETAQQEESEE